LSVTVTNKKGFVTGLKQENFQISIDKATAKIVHFSNDDAPVSVGMLLDASGSMHRLAWNKGSRLRVLQQALASFSSRNNKANEYFLIGFNEKAELWSDWTTGLQLIDKDIVRLQPFGETKLYDACSVAINKLQQGRHSRRVLVLISDGQDNQSKINFRDLLELVKEAGILVYSVHTSAVEPGTALHLEGQAILHELTSASGGVLYTTSQFNERDVNEIFEAIANELRNQYLVAIEPLPAINRRKWRKIKVKVSSPADAPGEMKNLTARTRQGYYSL
jgi:Ca-activated chloride channel family protein